MIAVVTPAPEHPNGQTFRTSLCGAGAPQRDVVYILITFYGSVCRLLQKKMVRGRKCEQGRGFLKGPEGGGVPQAGCKKVLALPLWGWGSPAGWELHPADTPKKCPQKSPIPAGLAFLSQKFFGGEPPKPPKNAIIGHF